MTHRTVRWETSTAKMETLLYNIYLTNVKEIESASEYQIKDRERKNIGRK